ncbi:MAG: hypothetical protein B7Z37_25040 [Verrucomicrobia bacterium 12-59-8]|nr:MAG: hypothetical protein B7Z37_25040 [Verrucomicrobia bacterium 12-59-8]
MQAIVWLECDATGTRVRKDVTEGEQDRPSAKGRVSEVLGVDRNRLLVDETDNDPYTVLVMPARTLRPEMFERAVAAYVRDPLLEMSELRAAMPSSDEAVAVVLKCMGTRLALEEDTEEQLEVNEQQAFEAKLEAVHRVWEETRAADMAQNGVMMFAPPRSVSREELFAKFRNGSYRRVDVAAAWLGWVLARKPEE